MRSTRTRRKRGKRRRAGKKLVEKWRTNNEG